MGTVVFLHKEEHKKFSEVEEKWQLWQQNFWADRWNSKKYFKK